MFLHPPFFSIVLSFLIIGLVFSSSSIDFFQSQIYGEENSTAASSDSVYQCSLPYLASADKELERIYSEFFVPRIEDALKKSNGKLREDLFIKYSENLAILIKAKTSNVFNIIKNPNVIATLELEHKNKMDNNRVNNMANPIVPAQAKTLSFDEKLVKEQLNKKNSPPKPNNPLSPTNSTRVASDSNSESLSEQVKNCQKKIIITSTTVDGRKTLPISSPEPASYSKVASKNIPESFKSGSKNFSVQSVDEKFFKKQLIQNNSSLKPNKPLPLKVTITEAKNTKSDRTPEQVSILQKKTIISTPIESKKILTKPPSKDVVSHSSPAITNRSLPEQLVLKNTQNVSNNKPAIKANSNVTESTPMAGRKIFSKSFAPTFPPLATKKEPLGSTSNTTSMSSPKVFPKTVASSRSLTTTKTECLGRTIPQSSQAQKVSESYRVAKIGANPTENTSKTEKISSQTSSKLETPLNSSKLPLLISELKKKFESFHTMTIPIEKSNQSHPIIIQLLIRRFLDGSQIIVVKKILVMYNELLENLKEKENITVVTLSDIEEILKCFTELAKKSLSEVNSKDSNLKNLDSLIVNRLTEFMYTLFTIRLSYYYYSANDSSGNIKDSIMGKTLLSQYDATFESLKSVNWNIVMKKSFSDLHELMTSIFIVNSPYARKQFAHYQQLSKNISNICFLLKMDDLSTKFTLLSACILYHKFVDLDKQPVSEIVTSYSQGNNSFYPQPQLMPQYSSPYNSQMESNYFPLEQPTYLNYHQDYSENYGYHNIPQQQIPLQYGQYSYDPYQSPSIDYYPYDNSYDVRPKYEEYYGGSYNGQNYSINSPPSHYYNQQHYYSG